MFLDILEPWSPRQRMINGGVKQIGKL